MNTFLERLKKEEIELASKVIKLKEFISIKRFNDLSEGNQYLLDRQLVVMTEYVNILGTRIELLEK